MFAATMPSDIPAEPTEIAVKLAAAQAAQATAAAAQNVADECEKEAREAIATDPKAKTQKINLRDVCHSATDSVISMLKKMNDPNQ